MSTITTISYRSATNDPEDPRFAAWSKKRTRYSDSLIVGEYSPVIGAWRVFAPHFAKLREIESNHALIPEGSDPPSSDSLAYAEKILHELVEFELPPSRVVASAEGGVAICFVKGDKYSDIEILNSGEILGVTSNRKDRPLVWEIERNARGFARAVDRIREFCE